MSRFKYNNGDIIGPNNILMIKRLNKRGRTWYASFKCPKCGNPFEAAIEQIVSGYRKKCSLCVKKDGPVNKANLVGQTFGRLTVLEDDGTRCGRKVLWKCQCSCKDHNIIYTTTRRLKSGETKSCGCLRKEVSSERAKNRKTNIEIGSRYGLLTVLEEGRHDHGVYWKCKCDCSPDKIIEVKGYLLTQGRIISCGCVTSSKGEKKIELTLNELKITFNKEYIFNNCINPKTGSKLRFDFYLPDYNTCIEYDGIQHFIYTNSGWNTKENYLETVYRDSIKNQYCKENNIKLIRIPYTDFLKIGKNYIKKFLDN